MRRSVEEPCHLVGGTSQATRPVPEMRDIVQKSGERWHERGTYPGHHSSCCNVSREDSQKEDCAERKADTHCVE